MSYTLQTALLFLKSYLLDLPLHLYLRRSPDFSEWPSTTRPTGNTAKKTWKKNQAKTIRVASTSSSDTNSRLVMAGSCNEHLSCDKFIKIYSLKKIFFFKVIQLYNKSYKDLQQ